MAMQWPGFCPCWLPSPDAMGWHGAGGPQLSQHAVGPAVQPAALSLPMVELLCCSSSPPEELPALLRPISSVSYGPRSAQGGEAKAGGTTLWHSFEHQTSASPCKAASAFKKNHKLLPSQTGMKIWACVHMCEHRWTGFDIQSSLIQGSPWLQAFWATKASPDNFICSPFSNYIFRSPKDVQMLETGKKYQTFL